MKNPLEAQVVDLSDGIEPKDYAKGAGQAVQNRSMRPKRSKRNKPQEVEKLAIDEKDVIESIEKLFPELAKLPSKKKKNSIINQPPVKEVLEANKVTGAKQFDELRAKIR